MKKASGPPEHSQARIEQLETRVAELDHAILEMSDELYRQQRQIATLELTIRDLRARLEQIREQAPGDPRDEKPPHY